VEHHPAPIVREHALVVIEPAGFKLGRRNTSHAMRPEMALLHELDEFLAALGVAELVERLGLDLADAFAGDVEDGADFFEGAGEVAAADAEAQAQDLLLRVRSG
jgi:hypothetical protein